MSVIDYPDLMGYLAATLTTLSFVPQAYKVHKTRHTRDLSLGMFSLFSLGVASWLVYGILIGAWPVIVANAVTLLLASYILWHKLRLG